MNASAAPRETKNTAVTADIALEDVARALEEIVRAKALDIMSRSRHLTFAEAAEIALEHEVKDGWYGIDIVRRRMGLAPAESEPS